MGREEIYWGAPVRERASRTDRLDHGKPLFLFAGFTLNTGEAALLRDAKNLPLRPKSFDVLHYLVRRQRQLVRREELLAAIWPGLVVTDDSLTQCVVEIRRVLGDRTHSIVRTVLGRGYLLDVPVTVAQPSQETATADIAYTGANLTRAAPSTLWMASYSALLELVAEAFRRTRADSAGWGLFPRDKPYDRRCGELDIGEAKRNLAQAVTLGDDSAESRSSLAAITNLCRYHAHVAGTEKVPNDLALPLILSWLGKSLALDPANVEALLRLAGCAFIHNDDEKALAQMRTAIGNGHKSAASQAILAGIAFDTGEPELAIPLLRRTVTLDPTNAMYRFLLAEALYVMGQLPEAEVAFIKAAEVAPGLPIAIEHLTWINIHQRNYVVARGLAEELPNGPAKVQAEAILNHAEGDTDAAGRSVTRLKRYPQLEGASRLAYVLAAWGDRDSAFRWLSTASKILLNSPRGARSELTRLRTSPFFRPLHNDPRWNRWLAAANRSFFSNTDYRMLNMLREYAAGL